MALVQDPNKNPLNPPMAPNPLMPPPPMGTPPGAGFQSWASDPLNSMKVQASMTSPSSPLQPGKIANAQPMASATPPVIAPKPSPLLPPSMQEDMKANPGAYQNRIAKGKVGNILNMIAATSLGAAGGMKGNPGLGANYAMDVFNHDQGVGDANQKTYNNRIVAPQQQALANKNTESEITARDSNAKLKAQNSQAALAQHGLKLVEDENGNQTVVPDENSPVYQKNKAQQDYFEARKGLVAAQTELEKQKANPNSPQYLLAKQRLDQASQRMDMMNRMIDVQDKKVGVMRDNYNLHATGTLSDGTAAPGAVLDDNNHPIGTAFQGNVRPTGAQRAKGNLAESADEQIKDMKDIVSKRPDIFGPAAGRKTDFTVWVGSQDPDAQRFRAARTIAGDHLAGVFGGRSEAALNALDAAIGHYKDNPAAINAGLDQLSKANTSFMKAGTVRTAGNKAGGGGNPLPPPEKGSWSAPSDAPPAPKEDGHQLKAGGKVVAVSKGGKWARP